MAQAEVEKPLPAHPGEGFSARLADQLKDWCRTDAVWWAASFTVHTLGMCVLLLLGAMVVPKVVDEAPSFETPEVEKQDVQQQQPPLEHFEVAETPVEPTELNTETLTLEPPAQIEQTEEHNDDNPIFTPRGGGMANGTSAPSLGGLGGFTVTANGPGPVVRGKGGVGVGVGTGTHAGSGGDGYGFGSRGTGHRKAMLGSGGGTRQSERAVAGALHWLWRHQLPDGSWSLGKYQARCTDRSCTGAGTANADSAATAMGLLPFLAAGQTHKSKGPYSKQIGQGLYWLTRQQKPNGDLAGSINGNEKMYAHGLAAITLCEAYGLTGDGGLRVSAQAAINFIQAAQHAKGGWRYRPGEAGDTSVVGWQVMALKSAQMAYLDVKPQVLAGAQSFLDSVAQGGKSSGRFAYQPGGHLSPGTVAVGLLCCQYLGCPRDNPRMIDGVDYLMHHRPDAKNRNTYYWYYATQVMHNIPGPEWDQWNREMRRTLIETQVKEGCAAGSWDPMQPAKDDYGAAGGRLMVTSLSALTLEVYYRYLPLYRLETKAEAKSDAKPEAKAEPKADAKGGAKPKKGK